MKRRDEVLVGIFTTVAIIVGVLGAIWLARGGLTKGYPLYSRFTWGQGLKSGQPVWLSGATVGFVENIRFEPTGTLLVTYRIEKEYQVPRTAVASVMPNGFFGDVAIGLTPSEPSTQYFAQGDTVPTGEPSVGMTKLAAAADTITQGMSTLLKGFQSEMIDSGGLRAMRQTIGAMNALVVQLGQIAALQSSELQSTVGVLRSRVAAIDSQRVDSTVRALQSTAANLSTVTAEMRTTTDRFNALLAKADSGSGTISKLLNDPTLANDLHGVLARLDSLTLDIRKNPRKYITLSIF